MSNLHCVSSKISRRHCRIAYLAMGLGLLAAIGRPATPPAPKAPAEPPTGPFGLSMIRTADNAKADIDLFQATETCGVCHPRQLEELTGSMHLASHSDPLYRGLAELARKEAGPKVYAFCAGCHSPAGVVTGLIPDKSDAQLPSEAKAGVNCDVCHQVTELTGTTGPWKEPANASFKIQQGMVKFGNYADIAQNPSHSGEKKDLFGSSELCASCHTVIQPINGFHIEDTYGEWKAGTYSQKGIQCQDCHMRTVEEAQKVAETLQPVPLTGKSVAAGADRPIFRHYFVGGNANADILAAGKTHAQMAEARLKGAARLELKSPAKATAGKELALDVLVHNIAAGHNLPTAVTELRRLWVALQIRDARGKLVFENPGLDEHGDPRPGAIAFGAIAGDKNGKPTFKLWEMTQFLWKRTIAPKSFAQDTIRVTLPADAAGPLTIEARLLYQSAAPQVVAEIMGKEAFVPKVIEMTTAQAKVDLASP
jgi:hypothetical protein